MALTFPSIVLLDYSLRCNHFYLKPSSLPRFPRFSLQVERLSKSVVAKRAELQNLEAESSAKQARNKKYKMLFSYKAA